MSSCLSKILNIYSTQKHIDITTRLLNSSKETIISLLSDLLTMYMNDKNSSTLREYLTVTMAGYEHSEGKIGFNGFQQSSIIEGNPLYCEAKPKNINSVDFHNPDKKTRRKLNGGGNYTDYTWARFEKDKKEAPQLLVSGFIDGKLIYIIEFPFICDSFIANFDKKLQKHFPKGDVKGRYLRSCDFDYRNFIDEKDVKIVYLLGETELEIYKKYFIKKFYQKLISK